MSDPANPLGSSFDPFDRTAGSTSSLALHDDRDIVTFAEADHRALFRYEETPEGIQVTRIFDKDGSRVSHDVLDVCAVGAKTCKLVNVDDRLHQVAKEAQKHRDGALHKWLAEAAVRQQKVFLVVGLVLVLDPKATDYSVDLENADIDGRVPLDLVLEVAGGNFGAVPDHATRREYAHGVKRHGIKEARGELILFAHYQEVKLALKDGSIMGTIFRRRSSVGMDDNHDDTRPHSISSFFHHRRPSVSTENEHAVGPDLAPEPTGARPVTISASSRVHLELASTKFWATLTDATTPVSMHRELD